VRPVYDYIRRWSEQRGKIGKCLLNYLDNQKGGGINMPIKSKLKPFKKFSLECYQNEAGGIVVLAKIGKKEHWLFNIEHGRICFDIVYPSSAQTALQKVGFEFEEDDGGIRLGVQGVYMSSESIKERLDYIVDRLFVEESYEQNL
jgi:hypothetical protein